jgi:hypothetical protein
VAARSSGLNKTQTPSACLAFVSEIAKTISNLETKRAQRPPVVSDPCARLSARCRRAEGEQVTRTANARHSLPFTAIAVMLLSFGRVASGGERPYAFVQGAESLPQTGLELESWFGASRDPGETSAWNWWFGPVVGITDRVEAALYAIFEQPPAGTGFLDLGSLRYQVSYLLADRGAWPVDVRLRLEVGQPADSKAYTTWLYVIVSKDFDRLNLTANLVDWLAFLSGETYEYLDYWVGASFRIVSAVRIGAEFIGETKFDPDKGPRTTLNLGPSLSVGTGRVWASASYDFGLTGTSPRQGRIVIGLAF